MNLALVIIHVVISVILVVTVLMQHGKQQGLSGAIAGGAETFFGKNKGRTIDAILKKITAVVAVLLIISSLALTAVSVKDFNAAEEAEIAVEDGTVVEDVVEEGTEAPIAEEEVPVAEEEVPVVEEAPVAEEVPTEEEAEAPAAE